MNVFLKFCLSENTVRIFTNQIVLCTVSFSRACNAFQLLFNITTQETVVPGSCRVMKTLIFDEMSGTSSFSINCSSDITTCDTLLSSKEAEDKVNDGVMEVDGAGAGGDAQQQQWIGCSETGQVNCTISVVASAVCNNNNNNNSEAAATLAAQDECQHVDQDPHVEARQEEEEQQQQQQQQVLNLRANQQEKVN